MTDRPTNSGENQGEHGEGEPHAKAFIKPESLREGSEARQGQQRAAFEKQRETVLKAAIEWDYPADGERARRPDDIFAIVNDMRAQFRAKFGEATWHNGGWDRIYTFVGSVIDKQFGGERNINPAEGYHLKPPGGSLLAVKNLVARFFGFVGFDGLAKHIENGLSPMEHREEQQERNRLYDVNKERYRQEAREVQEVLEIERPGLYADLRKKLNGDGKDRLSSFLMMRELQRDGGIVEFENKAFMKDFEMYAEAVARLDPTYLRVWDGLEQMRLNPDLADKYEALGSKFNADGKDRTFSFFYVQQLASKEMFDHLDPRIASYIGDYSEAMRMLDEPTAHIANELIQGALPTNIERIAETLVINRPEDFEANCQVAEDKARAYITQAKNEKHLQKMEQSGSEHFHEGEESDEYHETMWKTAEAYALAGDAFAEAARLCEQECQGLLRESHSVPEEALRRQLGGEMMSAHERASENYREAAMYQDRAAEVLARDKHANHTDAWEAQARCGREAASHLFSLANLQTQSIHAIDELPLEQARNAREKLAIAELRVAAITRECAAVDADCHASIARSQGVINFRSVTDWTDNLDTKDFTTWMDNWARPLIRGHDQHRDKYSDMINFLRLDAMRKDGVERLEGAIADMNEAGRNLQAAVHSHLPDYKYEEQPMNTMFPANQPDWPFRVAGNYRIVPQEQFWEKGAYLHISPDANGGESGGHGGSNNGGESGGNGGDSSEGNGNNEGNGGGYEPGRKRWNAGGWEDFGTFNENATSRTRTAFANIKEVIDEWKPNVVKREPESKIARMFDGWYEDKAQEARITMNDTLRDFEQFLEQLQSVQPMIIAMAIERVQAADKLVPNRSLELLSGFLTGHMPESLRDYYLDQGLDIPSMSELEKRHRMMSASQLALFNTFIMDAERGAVNLLGNQQKIDIDVTDEMQKMTEMVGNGWIKIYEKNKDVFKTGLDTRRMEIASIVQEEFMKRMGRRISIATLFGGFGIGPTFMALQNMGMQSFGFAANNARTT